MSRRTFAEILAAADAKVAAEFAALTPAPHRPGEGMWNPGRRTAAELVARQRRNAALRGRQARRARTP